MPLGRRISSSSGEERESLFLFQRISITMQRFNAILLHNCFVRDDPDHGSGPLVIPAVFSIGFQTSGFKVPRV